MQWFGSTQHGFVLYTKLRWAKFFFNIVVEANIYITSLNSAQSFALCIVEQIINSFQVPSWSLLNDVRNRFLQYHLWHLKRRRQNPWNIQISNELFSVECMRFTIRDWWWFNVWYTCFCRTHYFELNFLFKNVKEAKRNSRKKRKEKKLNCIRSFK